MTRPLTAAEIYSGFRMEADNDGTGTTDTGTEPAADENAPQETPEEKLARLEAENAEIKRHSRTWEQRAKDNKDKAKKLDEIEAANATPDQKLTAAEKRASDAESELARYRVAHETALPTALLSLLNGDEDAMREQAKALLAFKGETPPKKKPAADPTQGGSGDKPKPDAAAAGREEAQRRIAARQRKS